MLKKGVVVPVILMLLAAGFWWFAVSRQRALAGQFELTQVIAARVDLPANAVLNEDLLETRTMPRQYMQRGAYEVRSMSDMKLLNGRITAVMIPKGDQVSQSCLVSASQTAAADRGALPPAQQQYLEGLKFFQDGDYERARKEWKAARKLDPSNAGAAAGLKRIEQILAVPGQK